MRRLQPVIAVLFLWLPQSAAATELTDAEIRQILIAASIAAHPGSCPCPYNIDRAGRRGGRAPLCYASDITERMLREYRAAGGT